LLVFTALFNLRYSASPSFRKAIVLVSDFDFKLPDELIARYPLASRSASRLLCLDGINGQLAHRHFMDLPDLITPDDLLVFNNTRVIPARLNGVKDSGGKIEILIERILAGQNVLVHLRASKKPRPGSRLYFAEDVCFTVIARHDDLFELRCEDPRPVMTVIEKIGAIPLPPYFHRDPEANDNERYQTVYALHKGSVAAPTAGLHFDTELLARLQTKKIAMAYLTLHVGAGTFAPVRVANVVEHHMHAEYLELGAELCEQVQRTKARGGRIIAVGTTSARSLETASRNGQIAPYHGTTDIFIYPGFKFNCVDVLITNFHFPQTTLLMLVSAFAGQTNTLAAYAEAVAQKYRFFSYGDAMFVTRKIADD
jgi:S-adenosylmethionine:tRNA ribosyltransferase-isomerase